MNRVTDESYVRSAAKGMVRSMAHYGNTCPAVGDGRVSTPAWYANRLGKVFNARGDKSLHGESTEWWGTRWLTYAEALLAELDAAAESETLEQSVNAVLAGNGGTMGAVADGLAALGLGKNPTPVHLRPTSCHVCGSEKDHGPTFTETGKGHNFWSNADAAAEFAAMDSRSSRPGYAEARYVAEHRPY